MRPSPRPVHAAHPALLPLPLPLALASWLLVILAGCGGSTSSLAPTSPGLRAASPGAESTPASAAAANDAAGEQGLFLHLAVGNHAEASLTTRMRIQDLGNPVPGDWETRHEQLTRTIEGTDTRGEETYFAAREVFVGDDGSTGESTDLERQDRTGLYLYQADVPAPDLASARGGDASAAQLVAALGRDLAARGMGADRRAAYEAAATRLLARVQAAHGVIARAPVVRRAGAAPGGIAPHEITLLRYPLHPGATWEGRIGFNVWTVEAREPLLLPAGRFSAVRLRIEVPGTFGPNDRYAIWYAAPGEVAHQGHFETPVTNDQGSVIGTMEVEDLLQLTRWDPAARR